MKYLLSLAASALTGLAATAAPATVINFNSAPASFTTYTESGATITAGGQEIIRTGTPNGTDGILANGSPRAEFRATFAGGATGLVSIDLGDFNSDPDLLFLEAFNSS